MFRVNGETVLKMCKDKQFNDGDIIIAFQEDSLGDENTSIYTYESCDNGSFEIVDIQTGCMLDIFDLVECSFLVVKPKRVKEEDKDKKINEWCEKLKRECNSANWNTNGIKIEYY